MGLAHPNTNGTCVRASRTPGAASTRAVNVTAGNATSIQVSPLSRRPYLPRSMPEGRT